MSNFICPTCGVNNIDCGTAGFKTYREIELEYKLNQLEYKLAQLQHKNANLEGKLKWRITNIKNLSAMNATLFALLRRCHDKMCKDLVDGAELSDAGNITLLTDIEKVLNDEESRCVK